MTNEQDDSRDWWDPYSEQPYRIPQSDKRRGGADNVAEYAKIAATALLLAPLIALRYAIARPLRRAREPVEFVGLSITDKTGFTDSTADLVHELGVRHLLCRVPAWDPGEIASCRSLVDRFPDHSFVINVLQNRDSVRNIDGWRRRLDEIFDALGDRADAFQIGNAINRMKWGCRNSAEYLRLLEAADEVRRDHPGVRLAGSSVIDFEPLVTLRTLVNAFRYRMEHCAIQLYVNRRGSPFSRQFRFFDLERKIRLIRAMVSLSNHGPQSLWITETNWPLLGTKPYTPNSGNPRSTVDEPTQARYLTEYYRIAWHCGLVDRVYWWQLINPGYGLVDHRGGRLRRMPSFFAFRRLLEGDLLIPPGRA